MELVEGNITDIGGVKKLLKYISGEYFLAIASSSAPQNIELVLDETGLDSFFEVKVSAKEEGLESKPAPDVYVEAAERLGVRPEDCLALEDSINGVESAKNAGMEVVGYSEEKEDLPADIVIGDMLDLRRKEII
jgi:beta-phosphoglucomutase-like phosphatase (HAD superfamily)